MRRHPGLLVLAFVAACGLLLGGRVAQARGPQPAPAGDGLTLAVTVGLNPQICSGVTDISVPAGTPLTYCYTLTNNTGLTLTRHTLHDGYQNNILADYPYTLTPGASVALTRTLVVYASVINTATWQATQPITGYVQSEIACVNYPDVDGGQNLQLADDEQVNLTLPFAFDFYDRHSDRLTVSNNGVLLFDEPNTPIPFTNEALPTSAIPHGLAAFWDDWDDETGAVYAGNVTIPNASLAGAGLAGLSPQGSLNFFAVEYRGRSTYQGPSNPGSLAVMLLAPGQGFDGLIIVCYADTDFDRPAKDFGASATIGLNHNSTTALLASHNTVQVGLTGTFGIQYMPIGTHAGFAATDAVVVQAVTTIDLPITLR